MKIMLTGHRPQKLGGFADNNPTRAKVIAKLEEVLRQAQQTNGDEPLIVITGMALGCDQWWALVALELGIPVHAYIPFTGQEKKWPHASQKLYQSILERCDQIHIVSSGEYESWKMQARNRAMVDAADICVAIWDTTSGGTANCVQYIESQKKPCLQINPGVL